MGFCCVQFTGTLSSPRRAGGQKNGGIWAFQRVFGRGGGDPVGTYLLLYHGVAALQGGLVLVAGHAKAAPAPFGGQRVRRLLTAPPKRRMPAMRASPPRTIAACRSRLSSAMTLKLP